MVRPLRAGRRVLAHVHRRGDVGSARPCDLCELSDRSELVVDTFPGVQHVHQQLGLVWILLHKLANEILQLLFVLIIRKLR